MIKQEVTQIGNPVIRRKSKKVKEVTSKKTKRIVRDLIDSMRFHGLVGMAAPQIGLNLRIFVTEIRKTKIRKKQKEVDPLRVCINPRIAFSSKGCATGYEGCGSIASGELFGPVKRPKEVIAEAQNEKGEMVKLQAKGLLARVVQHEMDHLEGITFIDKVTDTKKILGRDEYIKKFQ